VKRLAQALIEKSTASITVLPPTYRVYNK